MSLFTKTANDTFSPYDIAGLPREIVPQDAQKWGTEVEAIVNAFVSDGGIIYMTKAELDADLTPANRRSAWVLGDPVAANNGIYRKNGASGSGSWTRVGDLPYSFIVAFDAGAGTANAIQAASNMPVSSSALIWMNVFRANTASPVTVSFNGGAALTIKTNAANDVAAGGLVAGMIVMGIVSGTTFRLISDQASAAIIAAAEGFANSAAASASAAAASLIALRETLEDGVNPVNSWRGYAELNAFAATGAAKSNVDGYLKLIASGASTQITLTGLAINGATERYLAVRYRRTAGTPGWDADEDAFSWQTAGHGFTSGFLNKIVNTTSTWKTAYLDMWNPSAGGTDWKTNTITGLRFFVGNGVGADIDIAWIATCADAPRRGDGQNDLRFAPISFLPNVASPLAIPLITKIKEGPVSLEDCGYVSGDALAALNKAMASGQPIVLLPKVYSVSGLPNTVTNIPVSIQGYGFGRSILRFTGLNNGLVISQADYSYPTQIKNIEIQTTRQEPGIALKISYSAADSIGNRNVPRCLLEGVCIFGQDTLTSGWQKGIVLENVHRPHIVRPEITGRRNLSVTGPAQFKNMLIGIEVIGQDTPAFSSIPSDILIENPRIDSCTDAINSHGEVEGLHVNLPILVGVDRGVVANYTTKRPWVKVSGGHMNVMSRGVDLKNAPQSSVSDLLVYKYEGTTNDTYGVALDGCDDTSIKNLAFINQAADAAINGQWNGIDVKNSVRWTIDDIRHTAPSKTVIISGSSTLGKIGRIDPTGTFPNATAQEVDDTSGGNNQWTQGNVSIADVKNASPVTVTGSAGAVASYGPIKVCKGARYRMEGFVLGTKVGAAGDFVSYLTFAGTGAGVFGADRSSVSERSAQGASATVSHCPSGILKITQSGDLTFQLLAASTGSNSNVVAGDAQMSITQL